MTIFVRCLPMIVTLLVSTACAQATDSNSGSPFSKRWETRLGGLRKAIAAPDSETFILRFRDRVLAIDGATGRDIWATEGVYSTMIVGHGSNLLFAYDPWKDQIDAVSVEDGEIVSSQNAPQINSLLIQAEDGSFYATCNKGRDFCRFRRGDSNFTTVLTVEDGRRALGITSGWTRVSFVALHGQYFYFTINHRLAAMDIESRRIVNQGIRIDADQFLDRIDDVVFTVSSKEVLSLDVAEHPLRISKVATLPVHVNGGFATPAARLIIYAQNTGEHQQAWICGVVSSTPGKPYRAPWQSEEIADVVPNTDRTMFISFNRVGEIAGWSINPSMNEVK